MVQLLSISELAGELGVTARTIRFYEDKQLIKPQRVGANRVYNYKDRARMQLILRGKRLGFSLDEIREYMDLYDADPDPAQHDQVRFLLERVRLRQAELHEQQQDIQEMLGELAGIEAECLSIVGTTDNDAQL
ncbi:MAG: MerR family transcriptional regulator [Thiothrix nivea]|nr:MAG: MerR family transcriptional regulator [Thiothrix nivea]